MKGKESMEQKRFLLLDMIRGIALISMIGYHLAWDLVYLFDINWKWYQSEQAYLWQQSICWTFILLSGFSFPLGHHKWKRGLTVFMAGAVISVITCICMPENRVLFGVLTLIGSCAILMAIAQPLFEKIPSVIGLGISAFLFLLFRNINVGYLGFEDLIVYRLPWNFEKNLLTAYLGMPGEDFFSTDYFSLLPWCFLYLAGYFLYRICEKHKWTVFLSHGNVRPLCWIGRHTLPIYMLHQPCIYGMCCLVSILC